MLNFMKTSRYFAFVAFEPQEGNLGAHSVRLLPVRCPHRRR